MFALQLKTCTCKTCWINHKHKQKSHPLRKAIAQLFPFPPPLPTALSSWLAVTFTWQVQSSLQLTNSNLKSKLPVSLPRPVFPLCLIISSVVSPCTCCHQSRQTPLISQFMTFPAVCPELGSTTASLARGVHLCSPKATPCRRPPLPLARTGGDDAPPWGPIR